MHNENKNCLIDVVYRIKIMNIILNSPNMCIITVNLIHRTQKQQSNITTYLQQVILSIVYGQCILTLRKYQEKHKVVF